MEVHPTVRAALIAFASAIYAGWRDRQYKQKVHALEEEKAAAAAAKEASQLAEERRLKEAEQLRLERADVHAYERDLREAAARDAEVWRLRAVECEKECEKTTVRLRHERDLALANVAGEREDWQVERYEFNAQIKRRDRDLAAAREEVAGLELDLARARDLAMANAGVTEHIEEHPSLAGRRVLVVEDEPRVRFVFVAVFEAAGANVRAVGNLSAAWAHIQGWAPEIVVADLRLAGGQDGCEVVRRLRALPGPQRHTPALAVTGFAADEDHARCREAGFDEVLLKPTSAEQLVAVAVRLLDGRGTGELVG